MTGVRLNQIVKEKMEALMSEYPEDYPTQSDVLRAGVYALFRMKKTKEGKEVDEEVRRGESK